MFCDWFYIFFNIIDVTYCTMCIIYTQGVYSIKESITIKVGDIKSSQCRHVLLI